ncbi:unnamed protein product, partial [Meganyctiphanes norvegica]
RAAVHTDQQHQESSMARRMTLIVITDAACWLPIIMLQIISLVGVKVPPQVFAWVAVFILPLNAAVNPLLYTLSTPPFLGRVRNSMIDVHHTYRRSNMRRSLSDAFGGVFPREVIHLKRNSDGGEQTAVTNVSQCTSMSASTPCMLNINVDNHALSTSKTSLIINLNVFNQKPNGCVKKNHVGQSPDELCQLSQPLCNEQVDFKEVIAPETEQEDISS